MWSLTTPRSVSSRPPETPIATRPASPNGKTSWATVSSASTVRFWSMWPHLSSPRRMSLLLQGRNCLFPGNIRKTSKRSWPLHRMLPEGTIWAFFVTCGVLRVRFFSCFPERCPYRSIDWTCMSKKDENRLYRSTDWTYESTLAVDKRKIVSATGKR